MVCLMAWRCLLHLSWRTSCKFLFLKLRSSWIYIFLRCGRFLAHMRYWCWHSRYWKWFIRCWGWLCSSGSRSESTSHRLELCRGCWIEWRQISCWFCLRWGIRTCIFWRKGRLPSQPDRIFWSACSCQTFPPFLGQLSTWLSLGIQTQCFSAKFIQGPTGTSGRRGWFERGRTVEAIRWAFWSCSGKAYCSCIGCWWRKQRGRVGWSGLVYPNEWELLFYLTWSCVFDRGLVCMVLSGCKNVQVHV